MVVCRCRKRAHRTTPLDDDRWNLIFYSHKTIFTRARGGGAHGVKIRDSAEERTRQAKGAKHATAAAAAAAHSQPIQVEILQHHGGALGSASGCVDVFRTASVSERRRR